MFRYRVAVHWDTSEHLPTDNIRRREGWVSPNKVPRAVEMARDCHVSPEGDQSRDPGNWEIANRDRRIRSGTEKIEKGVVHFRPESRWQPQIVSVTHGEQESDIQICGYPAYTFLSRTGLSQF